MSGQPTVVVCSKETAQTGTVQIGRARVLYQLRQSDIRNGEVIRYGEKNSRACIQVDQPDPRHSKLGRTVYSTTCVVVCIRQNSHILDALNEPVINYLRLVLGSPLLITVEVDKKEVNLIN